MRQVKQFSNFLISLFIFSISSFFVIPQAYASTNLWTGCIKSQNHTLYNVQAGSAPSSACNSGDTQISADDGDITDVVAGTGLTGGGLLGSVTLSLMDGGVTTTKLADSSISTAKILNGAVGTGQLADDAVATAKLLNGAVTTDKLANGSVTTIKLADEAVTTSKIASGSVTTATLADGSVTLDKIANNNSEPNRIQAGADASFYLFTFGSSSGPTYDPGIVVTVPSGKAYFYQIIYSGAIQYYSVDRHSGSTSFYADWGAIPLVNSTEIGMRTNIALTGYHYWSGIATWWAMPYNASWFVRLEEGTYNLKIKLYADSGGTMDYAYVGEQKVQVMRIF